MKLIITGDMHLDGSKTPVCRTDNYYQTQVNKLQFIQTQMKKYNAIHIDGGDVLDRATGSGSADSLKSIKLLLDHLGEMYGVLGNHTMKFKNPKFIDESLISVLITTGQFKYIDHPIELEDNVVLFGFEFGSPITHIPEKYWDDKYFNIAVYHGFVDEKPNPLIEGLVASDIVNEFCDDYNLIITADHHKPFVHVDHDCTLINTGSLMRTTINQIDYEPCIWLIDTVENSIKKIKVPIIKDVISTEHKDKTEHKQLTMDSVIDVINGTKKGAIDYEGEIANLIKENKKIMNDEIKVFIEKALEEDKA